LGSTTHEEEEEEEEEEPEELLLEVEAPDDDDERCLSSCSSPLALSSFASAFLPQASRSALLLTESRDSIGLGWRTLVTAEEGEGAKPTERSEGNNRLAASCFSCFFFFFPPDPLSEPKSLAFRES
jgi:hypothetical protein